MVSGRSEGGKSVASERSQSKMLLLVYVILNKLLFNIGSIAEIKKRMVQEKKDWDNIVRMGIKNL